MALRREPTCDCTASVSTSVRTDTGTTCCSLDSARNPITLLDKRHQSEPPGSGVVQRAPHSHGWRPARNLGELRPRPRHGGPTIGRHIEQDEALQGSGGGPLGADSAGRAAVDPLECLRERRLGVVTDVPGDRADRACRRRQVAGALPEPNRVRWLCGGSPTDWRNRAVNAVRDIPTCRASDSTVHGARGSRRMRRRAAAIVAPSPPGAAAVWCQQVGERLQPPGDPAGAVLGQHQVVMTRFLVTCQVPVRLGTGRRRSKVCQAVSPG